ncbi:MAG: ABC transporter substrate-binding protein [Candidatus Rokubacteria bacterium]|nr:ABC transporter substrate-binding protein [Candidatus Rokubacteria bacterium]
MMPVLRALASLVALALVALPIGPVEAQRRGGAYRAVLGADPPTLDPAQATDTTSSAIIRQVFDGLVELDEKMQVVPAIAEKWTVSRDQRVYTFTLRRGVRFHHGREVRAADVKYSLERAARGKKPWVVEKLAGAPEVVRGQAKEIRGIRVLDDQTVELTLERPFPPFLMLMAYDAAFLVPREEAERLGSEFASRPVGTGAFRFVSWRHDDQVVLEAFRDHFRGAPYLDRVVYRVIPDDNTRFQEYRAGSLEHVDVPTGQFRAAQADPVLSKERHVWPILGTYALRFTMTQTPFKDNKKLRQALNYAIDKEAIARVLLEGSVVPARGVLPPGMPGHNPELVGYPHDRARARQLLAEAGHPDGRGLPPITLHYNTSPLHRRVAELVQAQLREVGLAIQLARLDWAAYIKLVDDGGTQWHRMGWIADYPDPENFLTVLFHTRNIGPPGNTSRFSYPEVDRLFDEADRLPAGPARLAKYREAEKLIVEEAPWVFVYWYTSRLLQKPWVRGLERSPMSVAPEMHMAPLRKVWLER